MVNWKVVKPKPRYEDLMDDMFSKLVYRNITSSPKELNHLDLPNPLMFGSTDAALDKLSRDKKLASPSIDISEPRVSLHKDKVVPNVEMRDADKSFAASEEKLSLSKSDLDEIESYVRTYVDMKFNDLQKFMVDQYTGLLGVVKEGVASFGKVAQYPVHESEKGNPDIEEDPPQSLNVHTTDAKNYNVVDAAGQSSKLGGIVACLLRHMLHFLSDQHHIPSLEFDPNKHRTRYTSLLWDFDVNKACTGYVSDDQDPPRPKRTFIQSEDTKMIDVEP
ncbi:hypothetical protein FXO37_19051 [Capsicum annuum]|nr:hypothetical protein FXO37_19051 [Capsicum annuum]